MMLNKDQCNGCTIWYLYTKFTRKSSTNIYIYIYIITLDTTIIVVSQLRNCTRRIGYHIFQHALVHRSLKFTPTTYKTIYENLKWIDFIIFFDLIKFLLCMKNIIISYFPNMIIGKTKTYLLWGPYKCN
jgi:hypothetical protein